MISYNYTTWGCWTIFRIWISLETRSTSATSTILLFSRILTATRALVRMWVPILTFPKVPSPIVFPNIYCPIFLSWGFKFSSACEIFFIIPSLDILASFKTSATPAFLLDLSFFGGDEVYIGFWISSGPSEDPSPLPLSCRSIWGCDVKISMFCPLDLEPLLTYRSDTTVRLFCAYFLATAGIKSYLSYWSSWPSYI